MSFENRFDAGRRLARALTQYRADRPIVLALPRGGGVVTAEVAAAPDAPLDLSLVRKIGVPSRRGLAMGAVADAGAPVAVRNDDIVGLENDEDLRASGSFDRDFHQISDQEVSDVLARMQARQSARPM